MKKIFFITSFFVIKIIAFAQTNTYVDSLEKAFATATIDTLKIDILSNLSDALYSIDPEKAYQVNQQMLAMTEAAVNNYKGQAQNRVLLMKAAALNNLGILEMDKGEVLKGLEYYQKSIPIFEKIGNKEYLANAYNNIGFIYENQGDVERGLDFYFKSLKLREEVADNRGIGESYNNIAYMYQAQGDWDKSLSTFETALTYFEKADDKQGIGLVYNNIGNILKRKKEHAKAIVYLTKSVAIKKSIEDHKGLSSVYVNIGDIFEHENKLDSAEYYYRLALKEADISANASRKVTALQNIAGLLNIKGKPTEALIIAKQSLALAEQIGFAEKLRDSHELLSDIYFKLNDYKNAYLHYKSYKEMSDSILSDDTKENTLKQQMKYSFDKREIEIEQEKQKNELLHQQEIAKQRYVIYFSVLIAVLVIVFSFFLYKRFRVTQRQKNIIEKQKTSLEEQKKIVEYQKEIVEEKNKEITDSISYAKRIQQAILPSDRMIAELLPHSFILYLPKDIVAGDFYWVEETADSILVAAADCTGHGVPGAMVSVVCHNALTRAVREFNLKEPAAILDKTKELVLQTFAHSEQDVKDGMDISLCSISKKQSRILWAGANNPLWVIRNKEVIELKPDKQPIGKFEHAKPFTNHSFDLMNNDTLYLFSDGYADQFGGEKGKKYKYNALKELLVSLSLATPEKQQAETQKAFAEWKGNLEQVDDVLLIGISCKI